jgi:hypothetical protein
MSTLHIRGVPEDLYARLNKLAYAGNRLLSARVAMMYNLCGGIPRHGHARSNHQCPSPYSG